MSDGIATMFTTPAMAAIFAPAAHVAQLLRFEAALARAEARAGVIPQQAAAAIVAACVLDSFDVESLYRDAVAAGTLAIPLVRALAAQTDAAGRAYVHWGATSQDALDSALMLQMRDGLALLDADLLRVCAACALLAERYGATVMAGRTLLQHATPISFGLKAARWLALATRQVHALRALHDSALALQFGGAAGTLAALGDKGLAVAALLADELVLPLPDLPWHAERDRVAAIAAALGIVAGAMAKIATDLALLAQTEVSEASEAAVAGKGGSSAMPHKRNPVDTMEALAAARLALGQLPVVLAAMAQEHERAVGAWQAEWVALPELFRYTAGAVARVASALEGLQVDEQRMQTNLAQSGELIMAEALTMALAPQLGRGQAQQLIAAIAQKGASATTFRQALHADPQVRMVLSPEAIDRALDPSNYQGSAQSLIERALLGYQALTPMQGEH